MKKTCFDFYKFSGATAATYTIRVGEHDIAGSLEPNAWTYELERFIKHPLYNEATTENDICLLKTKMVRVRLTRFRIAE